MEDVVKEHLNELKFVCENHHVQTLYLFGSGATSRMNSQSDLDFLVQFNNEFDRLTYADNFFSLLERLETLFGRKVDLITVPSLKNPILKSEIDNTKVKLYAA